MKDSKISAILVLLLLIFLQFGTPAWSEDTKQKTSSEDTGKPASSEDSVKEITMQDKIELPDAQSGKMYIVVFKHKERENVVWKIGEGKKPEDVDLAENGYLIGTLGKHKNAVKYSFEVKAISKDKKDNTGKPLEKSYQVSLKVVPEVQPPKEETLPKEESDLSTAELLRMVGGYELSRASSAEGTQSGFFNLYSSIPLPLWSKGNKRSNKLGMNPRRIWGDVRLTSIPQQNEKNIGALSSDYFSDLTKLKFNEISYAAEFIIGLDFTLWSIENKAKNRHYTFGLIGAIGAITPLTTTRESVRIFKISDVDALKERYPDEKYSDKTKYVAFVPQERDRFYRQYYVGFRFKTYFSKDDEVNIFPGMFDATWGLNDAASGGKGHFFKKPVIRVDGVLPFKIAKISMYLYATAVLNMTKETLLTPLFMDPATKEDNVSPTSPNLLTIKVPENDRDYYRIGIGIDLATLFKKDKNNDTNVTGQASGNNTKKKEANNESE